jgi:hypothetical protein
MTIFHGRGIGSALMAALIDVADNWPDLKRLELTVYRITLQRSGFTASSVSRWRAPGAATLSATASTLTQLRWRGCDRDGGRGHDALTGEAPLGRLPECSVKPWPRA